MRNLKRVLSLTLASVMLLGMMVIGAGAAVDYPDVDDNDNVEAIDVLSTVGIMEGYETGNFQPDRQVTRAEMAAIMSRLMNLNTYVTGNNPFTDVPSWAEGYVSACYVNGIIKGYGNGKFGTEDPITAVQAAAMLMRALGYFKYESDYAAGFEVATIRQAGLIGLFDRVNTTKASDNMTRNQIAQLVLNTLQSGMVEPDSNSTMSVTTPDGFTVAQGQTNYVYMVARDDAVGRAINETKASNGNSTSGLEGYVLDLGEQLYSGELKLDKYRYDDFGRPSRVWEYKGETIGTYVKEELIKQEYTTAVTGKDLFDLLGSDIISNNGWNFQITIDGVIVDTDANVDNVMTNKAYSYFNRTYMNRNNKSNVGGTGNGVLTQVFVDPNTPINTPKKVDIAIINTYLAIANADYNEKKDEVNLKVYALDLDNTTATEKVYYKSHNSNDKFACEIDGEQSTPLTITGDDFAITDVKKDEIYMITQANGDVITFDVPDVIEEATLTAFSKNNYVISDSNQYNYNTTIEFDVDTLENWTGISGATNLKDLYYNLFLDPFGYLIGVEIVEATRNYIFLTGIDAGNSNLNNKTAEAAGILLDGTFINFQMNMTDSRRVNNTNPTGTTNIFETGHALYNTWCTYTVDKSGIYTLKEVGNYDSVFAPGTPGDNTGSDTKAEKAGQYHDLVSGDKTIDTKRVSLTAKDNGTLSTADDNYVYGNDNSIYLVAELKEVRAKNEIKIGFPLPTVTDSAYTTVQADIESDKPVIIISGVDTWGTGIDNVGITTFKSLAEIKDAAGKKTSAAQAYPGWIYTLFDNDGYVIAAVIVGEDDGSNKNLVYVNTSDVKEESYSSADDEWTWTREVIFNGEPTTLTEIGSGLSKLGGMTPRTWYEVTFKADGSVRDVKHAFYRESGQSIGRIAAPDAALSIADGSSGGTQLDDANKKDFTDNINFVEGMNVDGKSTYLYEEVWGNKAGASASQDTSTVNGNQETTRKTAIDDKNRPTLIGSTLYTAKNAPRGFYVDKNVKSVFIQKNSGKTTTSYGNGISDLQSFLNLLNYEDNTFLYKISAVITNSRATVVVIDDWNGTNAATGTPPTTPTITGAKVAVTGTDAITGSQNIRIAYLNAADEPQNVNDIQAIVESWAADNSYTLGTRTVSGSGYNWPVNNKYNSPLGDVTLANTSTDIVQGVRVFVADKDGGDAGIGYEIVDASGNSAAQTYLHVNGGNVTALWIKNNTFYTAAMAPGATSWTYSDVIDDGTTALAGYNNTDGSREFVIITGHDYKVCANYFNAKVTVDGTAKHTKTGVSVFGSSGQVGRGDAVAVKPTNGKYAVEAGTPTTFTDYDSVTTVAADGETWTTGYVKITAGSGVTITSVTNSAGTVSNNSGYHVKYNDTSVVVTISGTDGDIYQALDENGALVGSLTMGSSGSGTMGINPTNSKDITVGKILSLALTADGDGQGTMPVTVKFTEAGNTSNTATFNTKSSATGPVFKVPVGATVNIEVSLSEDYTDNEGDDTITIVTVGVGTKAADGTAISGVTVDSGNGKITLGAGKTNAQTIWTTTVSVGATDTGIKVTVDKDA